MIAAIALLVALPVLAVAGVLASNRLPWHAPPGFGERLVTYLSTNTVQTSPDPRFPERRELHLVTDPAGTGDALESVISDLGWRVTAASQGRIDAEVRSRVFGFVDDIRVEYEARDPDGVRLDVRASSRVGRADLGTNTRHLLTLREALASRGLLAR